MTPRDWGVASDLMTATVAQTVAGVVFCPIDIVKQRVQTASVMGGAPVGAVQLTPLDAAKEVWTHQGLRGFFRGYWTMNALWMPWNLIYLSLYEECKRRVYSWQMRRSAQGGCNNRTPEVSGGVTVLRDLPTSQVIPVWAYPLCSSSCASVAAVATHPIDVVKTRLQVLSAAQPGRRRSAFQVAAVLWAQEGAAGFTRGLGARVATLSMGSAINWFGYEMVKRQLAAAFSSTD